MCVHRGWGGAGPGAPTVDVPQIKTSPACCRSTALIALALFIFCTCCVSLLLNAFFPSPATWMRRDRSPGRQDCNSRFGWPARVFFWCFFICLFAWFAPWLAPWLAPVPAGNGAGGWGKTSPSRRRTYLTPCPERVSHGRGGGWACGEPKVFRSTQVLGVFLDGLGTGETSLSYFRFTQIVDCSQRVSFPLCAHNFVFISYLINENSLLFHHSPSYSVLFFSVVWGLLCV